VFDGEGRVVRVRTLASAQRWTSPRCRSSSARFHPGQEGTETVRSAPPMQDLSKSVCTRICEQLRSCVNRGTTHGIAAEHR